MDQLTFIEAFLTELDRYPDKPLFTFVDEQGNDEQTITNKQLYSQAIAISQYLIDNLRLQKKDVVLLVYPQSIDFICALLGCLMAQVIPAVAVPPNPYRDISSDLEMLNKVSLASGAKCILTNKLYDQIKKLTSLKLAFKEQVIPWPSLHWHRTDQIQATQNFEPKLPQLEDIAFLQFSSGSTSAPKSIAVTYKNLSHQLHALKNAFAFNQNTVAVSWIPHYHATGLVSVILSTLYNYTHTYLLSPLTFINKPSVWFDVVTRVSATHTASPEFGIKKMIEYQNHLGDHRWNLSSLQVLCAGGEANHSITIKKFINIYSKVGFNPLSYCPCYGLSENTLGVATIPHHLPYKTISIDSKTFEEQSLIRLVDDEHPHQKNLVSSGPAMMGVTIAIKDPNTGELCQPGKIGEIWVKSQSKSHYYGELKLDDDAFNTGDLGAYLEDHLYVTGRSKDIIILNGRNLYPQDIENKLANIHPLINNERMIAVEVIQNDNRETLPEAQLLLLIELKEINIPLTTRDDIMRLIRKELYQSMSISCKQIVLLKPNSLSMTASHKIRRQPNKEKYLKGEFNHQLIL